MIIDVGYALLIVPGTLWGAIIFWFAVSIFGLKCLPREKYIVRHKIFVWFCQKYL